MSHTRAGLLFLLPEPVASARLLAGTESWRAPLEEAGVTVDGDGRPDLVVASAAAAAEVAAGEAGNAILLGRGSLRPLERAGWTVRRFLPIPSLHEPAVLVPLDQPGAARYALANLSVPSGLAKRARNVAAGVAISAHLPLPGSVALASRTPGPAFLVRDGQALGLPDALDWFLVLGRAIERSAYFLFERGAREPSWVLKFSPDSRDPERFLEDERGYELISEVGGVLAEHTPRLVGVRTDGERPLTVESAALGAPLVYWLRSSGPRARKQAVVEAVARWLVDVQASTAVPGRAREGFDPDGFPPGIVEEVGADVEQLAAGLDALPGVVEHRDLDPTHVLVHRGSFTVIDWEEGRRHGMPFADLAFFLAQALAILDGELDDPAIGRRDAFARLFRGESASGPLLFELMRQACTALDVAPEAVGPVLSLTWLRLSAGPRRHLAEVWFSDPALGPAWSAWRDAAAVATTATG